MESISRRDLFRLSARAGVLGVGAAALSATAAPVAARADEAAEGQETFDAGACYSEGYSLCVDVEAEGSVLLKNEGYLLPLDEGTKVTLLGSMSYNYIVGGSGQGADDQDTVLMSDAFVEAGLDVNQDAWSWLAEQCGGARMIDEKDPSFSPDSAGGGFGRSSSWQGYSSLHEFPVSTYEGGKGSILSDGYTDYAIVTIARNGAEGASPSLDFDGDGSTLTGTTYLELGDAEKDLLRFCKENFAHTIVLLNSPNAMELGFLDSEEYNVEACLWIGLPGEAGIVGVGTLLTGRNCPSGRLVDTYAYDVTTNPTYYNTDDNRYANCEGARGGNQAFYQYEEGIYVGYRYFETADAMGYFDSPEFAALTFKNGPAKGYDQVVQFPFGYGMSYTTFSEEITDSDVPLEPHGTNSVTVKVTNTGSVAGKRVVELYMEAPWQSDTDNFGIKGVGLEKAKVVLVDFEKTDKLEPGASQELTITFDTDDLASFDNFGQGCYVLEAGEYRFNVQDDAHHWGESGSKNAAAATVSATLDAPIVYDEEGDVPGATYAGARSSDAGVARNVMDDVTAGDGNMLEGYLSRADIAGGMAAIMAHTSDEAPNENLREEAVAVLGLSGTDTMEYHFDSFVRGEKTALTKTFYCHGNDIMPFAKSLPDGTPCDSLEDPAWEQTYYVVEGEKDNGLIRVVDAEPSSGSYHMLTCDDMADVPMDTEEGRAIWDMLASETSIAEALEVQGNCGWQVPAVKSVGKLAQNCNDGPSEANLGKNDGGTFFPCSVSMASAWNRDLAKSVGTAHGHQDILFNVGITYGPAINTHRSPFGGRNYEYFSEDGLIAGEISGSWVSGVQSTGVGTFGKHMGVNDGDTNRGGNTTWVNEQAVREVYQRPFEIACKRYVMNGVMGSMNRVGMSWFHYGLYNTMLRDEWGWNGMLITDSDGASGDVYNTPQCILAVRGGMLAFNAYPDDPSTVAVFGDATSTVLGRHQLHLLMRDALFQYCGTKTVDGSGNAAGGVTAAASGSSGDVPVAGIAGGVLLAAAAVAAGLAVRAHKKKAAPTDAPQAPRAEDEDDGSQE